MTSLELGSRKNDDSLRVPLLNKGDDDEPEGLGPGDFESHDEVSIGDEEQFDVPPEVQEEELKRELAEKERKERIEARDLRRKVRLYTLFCLFVSTIIGIFLWIEISVHRLHDTYAAEELPSFLVESCTIKLGVDSSLSSGDVSVSVQVQNNPEPQETNDVIIVTNTQPQDWFCEIDIKSSTSGFQDLNIHCKSGCILESGAAPLTFLGELKLDSEEEGDPFDMYFQDVTAKSILIDVNGDVLFNKLDYTGSGEQTATDSDSSSIQGQDRYYIRTSQGDISIQPTKETSYVFTTYQSQYYCFNAPGVEEVTKPECELTRPPDAEGNDVTQYWRCESGKYNICSEANSSCSPEVHGDLNVIDGTIYVTMLVDGVSPSESQTVMGDKTLELDLKTQGQLKEILNSVDGDSSTMFYTAFDFPGSERYDGRWVWTRTEPYVQLGPAELVKISGGLLTPSLYTLRSRITNIYCSATITNDGTVSVEQKTNFYKTIKHAVGNGPTDAIVYQDRRDDSFYYVVNSKGDTHELVEITAATNPSLTAAVTLSQVMCLAGAFLIIFLALKQLKSFSRGFLDHQAHTNRFNYLMEHVDMTVGEWKPGVDGTRIPEAEEEFVNDNRFLNIFGSALPQPFALPDYYVNNFRKSKINSLKMFLGKIVVPVPETDGLFEEEGPHTRNSEFKNYYEAFCFLNNLKELPLKNLLTEFYHYGFILTQKSDASTEVFTNIRFLCGTEREESASKLEQLPGEDSLSYFIRCECRLTPFKADQCSVRDFSTSYERFCRGKRVTNPVPITKRAMKEHGASFERLKVNIIKRPAQCGYMISHQRMEQVLREIDRNPKPTRWWLADISAVLLHYLTVIFFTVPILLLCVFIMNTDAMFSDNNHANELTWSSFTYSMWNFGQKVAHFPIVVWILLLLDIVFVGVSFVELATYYMGQNFPFDEDSILKERRTYRRFSYTLFYLILFSILAIFGAYFILFLLWAILGAIISPTKLLPYCAAAITLLVFATSSWSDVAVAFGTLYRTIMTAVTGKVKNGLSETIDRIIEQSEQEQLKKDEMKETEEDESSRRKNISAKTLKQIGKSQAGPLSTRLKIDAHLAKDAINGEEYAIHAIAERFGMNVSLTKAVIACITKDEESMLEVAAELAEHPAIDVQPSMAQVLVKMSARGGDAKRRMAVKLLTAEFCQMMRQKGWKKMFIDPRIMNALVSMSRGNVNRFLELIREDAHVNPSVVNLINLIDCLQRKDREFLPYLIGLLRDEFKLEPEFINGIAYMMDPSYRPDLPESEPLANRGMSLNVGMTLDPVLLGSTLRRPGLNDGETLDVNLAQDALNPAIADFSDVINCPDEVVLEIVIALARNDTRKLRQLIPLLCKRLSDWANCKMNEEFVTALVTLVLGVKSDIKRFAKEFENDPDFAESFLSIQLNPASVYQKLSRHEQLASQLESGGLSNRREARPMGPKVMFFKKVLKDVDLMDEEKTIMRKIRSVYSDEIIDPLSGSIIGSALPTVERLSWISKDLKARPYEVMYLYAMIMGVTKGHSEFLKQSALDFCYRNKIKEERLNYIIALMTLFGSYELPLLEEAKETLEIAYGFDHGVQEAKEILFEGDDDKFMAPEADNETLSRLDIEQEYDDLIKAKAAYVEYFHKQHMTEDSEIAKNTLKEQVEFNFEQRGTDLKFSMMKKNLQAKIRIDWAIDLVKGMLDPRELEPFLWTLRSKSILVLTNTSSEGDGIEIDKRLGLFKLLTWNGHADQCEKWIRFLREKISAMIEDDEIFLGQLGMEMDVLRESKELSYEKFNFELSTLKARIFFIERRITINKLVHALLMLRSSYPSAWLSSILQGWKEIEDIDVVTNELQSLLSLALVKVSTRENQKLILSAYSNVIDVDFGKIQDISLILMGEKHLIKKYLRKLDLPDRARRNIEKMRKEYENNLIGILSAVRCYSKLAATLKVPEVLLTGLTPNLFEFIRQNEVYTSDYVVHLCKNLGLRNREVVRSLSNFILQKGDVEEVSSAFDFHPTALDQTIKLFGKVTNNDFLAHLGAFMESCLSLDDSTINVMKAFAAFSMKHTDRVWMGHEGYRTSTEILSKHFMIDQAVLKGLLFCARGDVENMKECLVQLITEERKDNFFKVDESYLRALVSIAHGGITNIEDMASALKFDPDTAEILVQLAASKDLTLNQLKTSTPFLKLCGKLGLEGQKMAALIGIARRDIENVESIVDEIDETLDQGVIKALMAINDGIEHDGRRSVGYDTAKKNVFVQKLIGPFASLLGVSSNLGATFIVRLVQGDALIIKDVAELNGLTGVERDIYMSFAAITHRQPFDEGREGEGSDEWIVNKMKKPISTILSSMFQCSPRIMEGILATCRGEPAGMAYFRKKFCQKIVEYLEEIEHELQKKGTVAAEFSKKQQRLLEDKTRLKKLMEQLRRDEKKNGNLVNVLFSDLVKTDDEFSREAEKEFQRRQDEMDFEDDHSTSLTDAFNSASLNQDSAMQNAQIARIKKMMKARVETVSEMLLEILNAEDRGETEQDVVWSATNLEIVIGLALADGKFMKEETLINILEYIKNQLYEDQVVPFSLIAVSELLFLSAGDIKNFDALRRAVIQLKMSTADGMTSQFSFFEAMELQDYDELDASPALQGLMSVANRNTDWCWIEHHGRYVSKSIHKKPAVVQALASLISRTGTGIRDFTPELLDMCDLEMRPARILLFIATQTMNMSQNGVLPICSALEIDISVTNAFIAASWGDEQKVRQALSGIAEKLRLKTPSIFEAIYYAVQGTSDKLDFNAWMRILQLYHPSSPGKAKVFDGLIKILRGHWFIDIDETDFSQQEVQNPFSKFQRSTTRRPTNPFPIRKNTSKDVKFKKGDSEGKTGKEWIATLLSLGDVDGGDFGSLLQRKKKTQIGGAILDVVLALSTKDTKAMTPVLLCTGIEKKKHPLLKALVTLHGQAAAEIPVSLSVVETYLKASVDSKKYGEDNLYPGTFRVLYGSFFNYPAEVKLGIESLQEYTDAPWSDNEYVKEAPEIIYSLVAKTLLDESFLKRVSTYSNNPMEPVLTKFLERAIFVEAPENPSEKSKILKVLLATVIISPRNFLSICSHEFSIRPDLLRDIYALTHVGPITDMDPNFTDFTFLQTALASHTKIHPRAINALLKLISGKVPNLSKNPREGLGQDLYDLVYALSEKINKSIKAEAKDLSLVSSDVNVLICAIRGYFNASNSALGGVDESGHESEKAVVDAMDVFCALLIEGCVKQVAWVLRGIIKFYQSDSLVSVKDDAIFEFSRALDYDPVVVRGFLSISRQDWEGVQALGNYLCDYNPENISSLVQLLKKVKTLTDADEGDPVSEKSKLGNLRRVQEAIPKGTDEQELFYLLDEDGSGFLDFNEFRELIKYYNLNFTNSRLIEVFSKYDEDNSGEMDTNEFLKAVQYIKNKATDLALDELGFSWNKLRKKFFASILTLILVFAFIFLGIQGFANGGSFNSVINSAMPVASGGILSGGGNKEDEEESAVADVDNTVDGVLDMLQSDD